MGIDVESARFLLQSRQQGVRFDRCLTLGRQRYFPGKRETRRLFRRFGFPEEAADAVFESDEEPPFAEPFWKALGAQEIETLDRSDYEGASVIHDLNEPAPESLRQAFDAVCDFGTIEHVFNFPTALRNCMEMVKPGGRLILHTPANNYCGHGFYQFSPELFYRTLNEENGFCVERMIAVEYGPLRRWFEAADPERIRARVNVINAFPALLFVQARRAAVKPLFSRWPQQSDYVSLWTGREQGSPERKPAAPWSVRIRRKFLEACPRAARAIEAFRHSPFNGAYAWRNRRSFRPVSKNPRQ